jgi:hypothetical protein
MEGERGAERGFRLDHVTQLFVQGSRVKDGYSRAWLEFARGAIVRHCLGMPSLLPDITLAIKMRIIQ